MTYDGHWVAGKEGTADYLNSTLLQFTVASSRPTAGAKGVTHLATDTLELSYDDGSAWKSVRQAARKSADQTISNSTTLVNITDMTFSVATNETWHVFLLVLFNSSTVANLKYDFTIPTGATRHTLFRGQDSSGAEATLYKSTGSQSVDGEAANWMFAVEMIVRSGGTAGTIQLQGAQNSAEVSNTKFLADSCLIAHKVA